MFVKTVVRKAYVTAGAIYSNNWWSNCALTGPGGHWARLPEAGAGGVPWADWKAGEGECPSVKGTSGEERSWRVWVPGGGDQAGAGGKIQGLLSGAVCLVLCAWFHCIFLLQDTLKHELCNLRKAVKGSEIQCQELQVQTWRARQTKLSGLYLIWTLMWFVYFEEQTGKCNWGAEEEKRLCRRASDYGMFDKRQDAGWRLWHSHLHYYIHLHKVLFRNI